MQYLLENLQAGLLIVPGIDEAYEAIRKYRENLQWSAHL